jgi:glycosyltransferase involved in cell wall biosynthesis
MSFNILHVSHTDIRYDNRILKELTALSSVEGARIHALGVRMDEGNVKGEEIKNLNISYIELKSRNFNLNKSIRIVLEVAELFFKSLLYIFKLRPKVIHCHDLTPLPVCVFAKLLFNFNLIYDAHELESQKSGITKFLSITSFYSEMLMMHYVDFLITVSPSIEKWYKEKFSIRNSALIFNSPFYDQISILEDKSYLRDKFNIPEKKKVFIYVGYLTNGRGIEDIIEVFKRNQSHVIVFLGYGILENQIVAACKESSNIFYHQPVSHNKVVEITSSADFGFCLIENISLSDFFCLPNKLFEYAFSNIPVIASGFPDIREFLIKHNIGVCVNDYGIESAIEIVLKSKFKKSNVIREYSWENQTVTLINVYRYLINLN